MPPKTHRFDPWRKCRGFTVMELVVVISVLAVLMILGISWVLGYYESARVTRMATDARVVEDAVHDYVVANSEWPIQGEGMSPESVAGSEDKAYTIDSLLEGHCVMSQDTTSGFEYYSIDPSALKDRVKISTSWDKIFFCLDDQRVRIVYGRSVVASSESEDEMVPEGYIPVASRSDLEAIGFGASHKFAEGTEWETEIAGSMSDDYAMVQDIELGSGNFEPIGYAEGAGYTSFAGIFDGNDFKIHNGEIDYPSDNYVGLFAATSDDAEVKDLGLEDVVVVGDRDVGGLVGMSEGIISNSYSTGSVEGNFHIAGLVGYNWDGTISNSYSTGNVEGIFSIGGLVGTTRDGTISNSYSASDVTSKVPWGSEVGGLVGVNDGNIIENNYSTGNVSGTVAFIGGLVGLNQATISNSYWDIETSGQSDGVGSGSDAGTTGLLTDQMQGVAAESNMSALDFESIWLTVTNPDNYPFLQWQDE